MASTLPAGASGRGINDERVNVQVSCQYGGQGGGGYYEDDGMTDRAVEYYMMQQQVCTRASDSEPSSQGGFRMAYGFPAVVRKRIVEKRLRALYSRFKIDFFTIPPAYLLRPGRRTTAAARYGPP